MDKYQEMQVLEYQAKQLEKMLETVETQLSEINNTIDALNGFANIKSGDEILFPVASGIFAKGKLEDNKMLRINIGSNIVVEKNVEDTIKMMNSQTSDMNKYRQEISQQLQIIIEKINSFSEESGE